MNICWPVVVYAYTLSALFFWLCGPVVCGEAFTKRGAVFALLTPPAIVVAMSGVFGLVWVGQQIYNSSCGG